MLEYVVFLMAGLILVGGCGSPANICSQQAELAAQFDQIELTVQDIDFIRELGLDPNNLSVKDKAKIIEEAETVAAAMGACL